ncbi:hypothetical protein QMK19_21100 [Streptomyces sp. H10-C2]|uniref:hypothetical protein n=1 Tax=unclassified Streptomyces TaxID=2593676 RepID=UPI0024B8F4AD|nr:MULTISPECIES: hypothetical protein [unclassified Streptomyces]MDJ0344423.1 hypothetical protein [Streptomyces sp. PH10-H1]MDJ0372101.1 hypothetical protein [Streptomyces sp. H10-C2]
MAWRRAPQARQDIGGASVADESMPSMALPLREQEMSLRDIAKKLVIIKGAKKGQHPSPATVIRMLREHDEQTAADDVDVPVRTPRSCPWRVSGAVPTGQCITRDHASVTAVR